MAALSSKRALGVAIAFVTVMAGLTATLAVMALRQSGSQTRDAGDPLPVVPLVSASGSPDAPSVAPAVSRPPSPSPSHRPSGKPSAHPKPSRRPIKVAKPPAPPKPPASCTSHRSGTLAPTSEVRSALTGAAAIRPWGSGSAVAAPVNLVEAVAWQESGWQSNVVSCIGALGLMQMTPDTAKWMNQRFGTSYDVNTVDGNAKLGSEYLQWLVKYFGDVYFQSNYDLTVIDPDNPTLLDAVLAAYNLGYGAVDTSTGLQIPNRAYVNDVERWMTEAPWPA